MSANLADAHPAYPHAQRLPPDSDDGARADADRPGSSKRRGADVAVCSLPASPSIAAPTAADACLRTSQPAEAASGPASAGRPVPPANFCCPISMDVMSDPVMIATGHTYDRGCIEKWFQSGHQTCPLSGQRLRHSELTPNIALRNVIQARPLPKAPRTGPPCPQQKAQSRSNAIGMQEWAVAHGVSLKPRGETCASPAPPRPHILTGHDEIVWALEYSDGRIFSASADRTVRVWCAAEKRCTAVLEGHTRPVLSLAAAGGVLFSGSYDNTIRVWDVATSRCCAVLKGHLDAVRALAIVGDYLFSGSYDSTLRAWRLQARGDQPRFACAAVLRRHSEPVRALVGLAGRVFSGSYDHTVCCWDAEVRTSCRAALCGSFVMRLCCSALPSAHTVAMLQTLELRGQLEGHTSSVRALASTNGLVFSGSDDSTIRCWDAQTLCCTGVLKGHQDNVRVLATSPEHPHYLFSGSWDKTVHVWDLRAQRCAKVLTGHAEAVLALAVNSTTLATGSYDTSVRLWDVGSFECVKVGEGHSDAVRVLCATGDRFVSGAYDGTLGLWNDA